MGRKKIATPVLEAYVRQAEIQRHGVWPLWLMIAVAAVPAVVASQIKLNWVAVIGLVASGGLFLYLWQQNKGREAALDPKSKLEFERGQAVAKLKHIAGHNQLRSYLPIPVLEELEAAARAHLHAIEELTGMGPDYPDVMLQVRQELDAELQTAILAAAIVTRSDDQGLRHVRQWEDDADLMRSVCRRIAARRERMEATSAWMTPGTSGESLRQSLARARQEREVAERELDESLGQL